MKTQCNRAKQIAEQMAILSQKKSLRSWGCDGTCSAEGHRSENDEREIQIRKENVQAELDTDGENFTENLIKS
ncbi:hypothetical protein [Planktothrix sp. PCC 11201]|uniref:hypothetical protein n=1 Tax=Planktothrix sp. PCC 11201 TaxID=1729650 RepID=UPI00117FF23F|nr:hypothetical protein [Planktothrix sp. PCC 11201]